MFTIDNFWCQRINVHKYSWGSSSFGGTQAAEMVVVVMVVMVVVVVVAVVLVVMVKMYK